ncbi:hypothetical protein Tco_0190270 [Tanacetum coccineum]
MTGNKAYLSDFEDFNEGICRRLEVIPKAENNGFKLLDESQVVLRAPRKDDVYSLDLKIIVPSGERVIFLINYVMKHSYSNDDTCFSIDVIDEILEEDFDSLLDEGNSILYSIEGTPIEEKLFAEFDEFMAMTIEEDIESDKEEPSFKKITFDIDYKIKTSLKETPTDLVLKQLPDHLEYVFLEEPFFLPVIISSQLSEQNKDKLIYILKKLLQIKEMADQDTPPPTITAIKIPIIKKGEYDIWSMRMRQYICHTDHNLWDIIVNDDLEDEATPSGEQSSPPVHKTAKQLAARRNQERIKSILILAIPDEYLLKFHNVPDAKSLWAAIKSRFGGNQESKKMQKNVLKHQFENFVTASNETLDKAYDRFQKLISQLEIHGAYVIKEDIN